MRAVLKGTLGDALRTLSVEDRLEAAWRVTCGRALSERSRVAGYCDGVVQIEVADGAWREHLNGLSGQIERELARIAKVKVCGIHFEVNHASDGRGRRRE